METSAVSVLEGAADREGAEMVGAKCDRMWRQFEAQLLHFPKKNPSPSDGVVGLIIIKCFVVVNIC